MQTKPHTKALGNLWDSFCFFAVKQFHACKGTCICGKSSRAEYVGCSHRNIDLILSADAGQFLFDVDYEEQILSISSMAYWRISRVSLKKKCLELEKKIREFNFLTCQLFCASPKCMFDTLVPPVKSVIKQLSLKKDFLPRSRIWTKLPFLFVPSLVWDATEPQPDSHFSFHANDSIFVEQTSAALRILPA